MATDAAFLIPPSLHVAALLLGEDGVTIRAVSEATGVRCRGSTPPGEVPTRQPQVSCSSQP